MKDGSEGARKGGEGRQKGNKRSMEGGERLALLNVQHALLWDDVSVRRRNAFARPEDRPRNGWLLSYTMLHCHPPLFYCLSTACALPFQ